MDEGDSIFLYSGGHSNCYHYVCSSNYRSKWQQQDSGFPTFLCKKVFMLFIISDALSLLSALTSLLIFLSVLTLGYAEKYFLKSLPIKMMIGLSTLILSIATMMITFCTSLFIILPEKLSVVIPIICLTSVPVALFAWMQSHHHQECNHILRCECSYNPITTKNGIAFSHSQSVPMALAFSDVNALTTITTTFATRNPAPP